MSNQQWESNSYYSDEESDDDYAPLQMSSWGGATATENRDGTTTVEVSPEGWASLIDPSVKMKANGIGSGQLHRKGDNFKPVDESYIINRRLNLPVKGSGKKSRSGSSTPKSAPKKKTVKKPLPPPPPRAERMVPPSSSANRGRPPINPNASAWGSTNLASTPFWEQQQSNTGSAASKYATNSAPPPPPPRAQHSQWSQPQQAPQPPSAGQSMASQWGQQTPQQAQQSAQQWSQNFQQQPQQQQQQQQPQQPQQPQQQQPPQAPVQQQQQQQSQWGQPQPQQPPQQPPQRSQWGHPQQQQHPPQQQPQQSHWGQPQPPQQQQPAQQPQSQAFLSKYAHGSDASIYAPSSAPAPQLAPTVQPKAGTPCIKFNIQLGVGITAELSVYQNDSPEEVVNNFEKRHHLNMSDVAKANFAVKIRELLKQYTGQ